MHADRLQKKWKNTQTMYKTENSSQLKSYKKFYKNQVAIQLVYKGFTIKNPVFSQLRGLHIRSCTIGNLQYMVSLKTELSKAAPQVWYMGAAGSALKV